MTDFIEFDPVDDIGAGAFGVPGQRTFVIQARKGNAVLSVLVEKEQVRLLAEEATQFLDRIAEDEPETPPTSVENGGGASSPSSSDASSRNSISTSSRSGS